jgi:hypothetical protein
MVENRKFSLPPEIDEILDRLPPQVTLNVPSDVLVHWFSPAPADGAMDEVTLARAARAAVDANLLTMPASVKASSTDW